MTPALVSKTTVAKATSLSARSVDNLVAAGKIPSVKVGRRRLFDIAEVIAALKAAGANH